MGKWVERAGEGSKTYLSERGFQQVLGFQTYNLLHDLTKSITAYIFCFPSWSNIPAFKLSRCKGSPNRDLFIGPPPLLTSERSEEVLFLRGVIWDVERIRVPQIRSFPNTFGPKCWNILTKLGEKVDFSIAESVAWFIFWWSHLLGYFV